MPVIEEDEWLPRTTSTYYLLRKNCRVEADENRGVGGGVFLPFRASASYLYETLFYPPFFQRAMRKLSELNLCGMLSVDPSLPSSRK